MTGRKNDMKIITVFFLNILLINSTFSSNYKTLISGRWLNTGSDGKRTIMIFSPKGEMGVIIQYNNKKIVSLTRNYNIIGNKIYVYPKNNINSYTFTIIKINETELIIKNETGNVYNYIRHNRKITGRTNNVR